MAWALLLITCQSVSHFGVLNGAAKYGYEIVCINASMKWEWWIPSTAYLPLCAALVQVESQAQSRKGHALGIISYGLAMSELPRISAIVVL